MGNQQRRGGLTAVVIAFLLVAGVLGCNDRSHDSVTKIESVTKIDRGAKVDAESMADLADLRNEMQVIDKDVKTLVNQLAKERVEVNQLKEKVAEMAAQQSKDKELITAHADAMLKAEGQVTFGNRTMTFAAAKTELEADVKRYTNTQKSLVAHEALLANRIKVRDSLEKDLETTKHQQSEFADSVNALDAELALLKSQPGAGKHQRDETRLAKFKEDLRLLRQKIDAKREDLKFLTRMFRE